MCWYTYDKIFQNATLLVNMDTYTIIVVLVRNLGGIFNKYTKNDVPLHVMMQKEKDAFVDVIQEKHKPFSFDNDVNKYIVKKIIQINYTCQNRYYQNVEKN